MSILISDSPNTQAQLNSNSVAVPDLLEIVRDMLTASGLTVVVVNQGAAELTCPNGVTRCAMTTSRDRAARIRATREQRQAQTLHAATHHTNYAFIVPAAMITCFVLTAVAAFARVIIGGG